MSDKYNTIAFCTSSYSDTDRYGHTVDEEKLFRDIADFLRIAMKNNYQCKMWFDGITYVIEFEESEELSGTSLEWVGEDEYVEKCIKSEPECIEKCEDGDEVFRTKISWTPNDDYEEDAKDCN